ncbi:tetratricopeptide repeat protein [Nocardioides gilvus]|uniref:tetratricopeptide repeat protein n=1 Tax=Nocardioides gilvus TaxID=1735589 RepID=UPI000D744C2C|nr:tetratricopeptide repeat protein [Nocardioides gilvus]
MKSSTGPHAIAARRAARGAAECPDQPGGEDDRTTLLRRAALLHLDGDWDGAQKAYEAVLADDPGHAVALNNLGLVRAQRRDPTGALAAYEAIGPDETLTPTALLNKANAHLALSHPDRALPLLQRAVSLDPGSSAWVALGQCHLVTGDLAAAEAALRQAYERLPARADVHRSYASCLAARGAVTEAADLLSEAVRLDPHEESGWRQFGAVLLTMRDLGSAARATAEAVRLAPDSVTSLRQMAVVLVALGRPSEAAEQLDRALAAERQCDVLVDRAVLHLACGEPDGALSLLDEACSGAGHPRAELYRAYALLAADRIEEGRRQLEAVTVEPYATQAREALERVQPEPS